MDAQEIIRELRRTLLRRRAGLITADQAKEETAILQAMLRAKETAELEEKLERIEAVLDGRRS